MRTRKLPVVLAAFLIASVAAVSVRRLNIYPYLPDELNEPCGKTVLEWNLMAGRVEAEPVPLTRDHELVPFTRDYELVRLVATLKPGGILARAYVQTRNPRTQSSDTIAYSVNWMVRRRFDLDKPSVVDVMEQRLYLLIYLDERLIDARGGDSTHLLPPDATYEEQLEAQAKIMSHAQTPQP